ncbi:MAG: hypothetical protein CMF37_14885 [Leeuwenhoekiella sp.]|nr:hypothetical protein [Leeuwenhoekiella sp.]MBQ50100.1 hypothetical protein [Leeuwenhoekiella sp.]MBQ50297.1 hypothetical protein [Leeuwenhoekiella sp.]MBQ50494.1 hypothetical protein [Leeuwenhoekiella sp.]|tara:strand:+ start:4768 stop:5421 length:654 start_codon:yes stop_codon:yes gene_type:complete
MLRPNKPDLSQWILAPETTDDDGNVVEAVYEFSKLSYDLNYIYKLMSNNVKEDTLLVALENYKGHLQDSWAQRCIAIDKQNDVIASKNKAIRESNATLTEAQADFKQPEQEYVSFPPMPIIENVLDYFNGDAKYATWRKLNAFEFNGTICSVTENDQNGWTSIDRLIERREAAGAEWQPIPFKNENGNTVVLATKEEWETFYFTAWDARVAFFGVSI